MQLILEFPSPDYAAWKSAFDAQFENIEGSGMSTLQIWRAADEPKVLVLFEVHNRKAAESWLARERAFAGAARTTFVETA